MGWEEGKVIKGKEVLGSLQFYNVILLNVDFVLGF